MLRTEGAYVRISHGASSSPSKQFHQTRELEKLMLRGRLLRDASPSLLFEAIPAWNMTAANAPKNPVRVTAVFDPLSFLQRRGDAGIEIGSRVSGVTSDLSLGGCFVCTRRTLDVGARVRGTLTHEGHQVKMFAVVRVVRLRVEWPRISGH